MQKRTALVTGANRGIGFAVARELAELGNAVLLGSRNLKAGEDAADALHRLGLDVPPIYVDSSIAAHHGPLLRPQIRPSGLPRCRTTVPPVVFPGPQANRMVTSMPVEAGVSEA